MLATVKEIEKGDLSVSATYLEEVQGQSFSLGVLAQPRANGLQSLWDEDFHGGVGRDVSEKVMASGDARVER